MLSIQVCVNGAPIIMVNAYRDMSLSQDPTEFMYRYAASCMPLNLDSAPATYTGIVKHDYDRGLAELTQLIMKDICKKGKVNGIGTRKAS